MLHKTDNKWSDKNNLMTSTDLFWYIVPSERKKKAVDERLQYYNKHLMSSCTESVNYT